MVSPPHAVSRTRMARGCQVRRLGGRAAPRSLLAAAVPLRRAGRRHGDASARSRVPAERRRWLRETSPPPGTRSRAQRHGALRSRGAWSLARRYWYTRAGGAAVSTQPHLCRARSPPVCLGLTWCILLVLSSCTVLWRVREELGRWRRLARSPWIRGRSPQCTDTEKRVQTDPLTRGNVSRSVRGFAGRSIFRNHPGTGGPGISVREKCPSCHPATSVHGGRVSPPSQAWYCSTDSFIGILLLCRAVLAHTPKTSLLQTAACATSLWKVEFDTA